MHFAHSRREKDDRRPWQELSKHLRAVAERAAGFAPPQWKDIARVAGLWHDCGKYQATFQRYISQDSEASNEGLANRVPHAVVGAALAFDLLGETQVGTVLALTIEAHHGALKRPGETLSAVQERGRNLLHEARSGGLPAELEAIRPECTETASALAVRMVFSALIDADLLDTEAWDRQKERENSATPLPILMGRLDALCREKIADAEAGAQSAEQKALSAMRRQVYEACIAAGETLEPGQFTLTVPTGGGETLSGLAFALSHAVRYSKHRVIVVAPYTSILEQTADIYRAEFGAENVIEHHSNISPAVDTDRNRQASENWDAPIIVTTSVQFFESLHAAHKRECRKLHRIANSVVLLDEVQTFPARLRMPIHEVLQQLVDDFGATVVHSTATQPLLTTGPTMDRRGKRGSIRFDSKEIMPDPQALFAVVRSRFDMEIFGDLKEPLDPSVLAEDVRRQGSALVITHRRDDARLLANLLGENCLHLSAAMCAAHRTNVLAEARRRLDHEEPCVLVATQLVEAGVDIDFPVVYRALAGLEALAQAAGRCNRAMKMTKPGRFVVYCAGTPGLDDEPVKESMPPRGTPMLGKQIAEQYFAKGLPDLNDPALFPMYSERVLTQCDLDASAITGDEAGFDFPSVAEKFRMIDERLCSVIVPFGEAPALLAALREAGPSRERYRALQRFIVGVRANLVEDLRRSGWLEAVREDEQNRADTLWCIREGEPSPYDPRFGLASNAGSIKLYPLQI